MVGGVPPIIVAPGEKGGGGGGGMGVYRRGMGHTGENLCALELGASAGG